MFGVRRHILDRLPQRLSQGFTRDTSLALTLGGIERTGSIGTNLPHEIYREGARSYDAIVAELENREIAQLSFCAREFEDETHTSVFAVSFTYAWRRLMQSVSA